MIVLYVTLPFAVLAFVLPRRWTYASAVVALLWGHSYLIDKIQTMRGLKTPSGDPLSVGLFSEAWTDALREAAEVTQQRSLQAEVLVIALALLSVRSIVDDLRRRPALEALKDRASGADAPS